MKNLSKAERLNQRIEELERQIYVKDNIFDKEQGKRVKRTFFVVCGVIYILFLGFALASDTNTSFINITSDMNTMEIIETIFSVIFFLTFGVGFLAGFIMFISYGVWFYIDNGAMKRVETIAKLEGELNAVKSEKYNNLEDEKIKELERHIEHLKNYQEKLIKENTYLRLNIVIDDEVEENE